MSKSSLRAVSNGADAGVEHARLHRFHHVIVGSGLKAAHDVQVVAPRGQHDDRDVATAAQPPAHLETVQSWEHHVEHHDVGGGVLEVAKRRLTGLGGAHPVAETA